MLPSSSTILRLCRNSHQKIHHPFLIGSSSCDKSKFSLFSRFLSTSNGSNANNKPNQSGNSPNQINNGNKNGNGGNNDDNSNKSSFIIINDGNGPNNGNQPPNGIFGNGFKSLTLPTVTKNNNVLEPQKPPEFYPVLPIIIGTKKPHFTPYSFIYTVTDPDLIEILQYRFKTKQPYVSIFLRRFDLDENLPVKNIEDLMPCGTMGEIIELKSLKEGISILVKGHYRIKLKSFINKTIVDQINDEEKLDKSFGSKIGRQIFGKDENGSRLKISQRQILRMRKNIRLRHQKNNEVNMDSKNEQSNKSPPLLVDTAKMDDEINTKQPLTKALTSELVKSLSEIYFVNPLILEYIHLLYPQHQEMFDSPAAICNFVASQFNSATPEEAYKVFAAEIIDDKIRLSLQLAKKELEMRKIGQQISKEVDEKIKMHHRKFLLQEQLKEIKKQLGVSKDDKEAVEEKIRKKIDEFGEGKIPIEVKKVIDEELNKLSFLDSHSSEFSVTRNYLDWLTSISWGNSDKEILDLSHTTSVLDADHYGMVDVKKRIKEFVAIAKLKNKAQGKILCFYGPPGVGKTSIGKSIAASLNRKYFRFSVGGMFDVAEIKGHRRTYVGAMPGKAVQCLKKVQTMNPLILIDEIDKLGRSHHEGDCSSALLEMLDPEQNSSFLDHYLDIPIDLSKVLFICTANVLNTIPEPLRDRMELIEVNGYTPEEKIQIAEKHLIPKVLEESGINSDQVKVTESGLKKIVDEYSRESGVRGLRQSIEKIFRRSAVKLVSQNSKQNISGKENLQPVSSNDSLNLLEINEKNLIDFADRPKYQPDLFYGCDKKLPVGIVTGLAWTGNGGSTLYIESVIKANKSLNKIQAHNCDEDNDKSDSKPATSSNNIQMTGNLGKVMQESMLIAATFAQRFVAGMDPKNEILLKENIHLHVPEGAIPKDGPSAGITITSALISLAINKFVDPKFAMTGEISLNGRVLPVGGIREKIIAAKREGIKNIILPAGVKNNFDDMPESAHEGLNIYFVEQYQEVYELIF